MYLTKLQEERFKRNQAIYDDYKEMRGKGGVSRWKICTTIAPKYNLCPMGIWRVIDRMKNYMEEEEKG